MFNEYCEFGAFLRPADATTLRALNDSASPMAVPPVATPSLPAADAYAEACEAWQHALDSYLRLAREGAAGAKLRAAAAAVQEAALRKGRLSRGLEDAGS